MLNIQSFTFNPFQENTYLIYDKSREAIIIDPGMYTASEQQTLSAFISRHSLEVKEVLNTHCHLDHVFGNAFCKEAFQVPLRAHKKDEPTLSQAAAAAKIYGVDYDSSPTPKFDLEEGSKINLGSETLDVYFTPGHAPGHVIFVHRDSKSVLGGDVIFHGSIGRTDLPGGNHDQLLQSIKDKIYTLPEDFTIYSGHGPITSVGHEKKSNPFIRG